MANRAEMEGRKHVYAPTISDSQDVKNEIALLKAQIASLEKLEEDRFGTMKQTLFGVFGLIGAMIVLGGFAQTKMLEKANQTSIDKSMQVAEQKISSTATDIMNKINGTYIEPAKLEQQIIGSVHQTFERPVIIKREVLYEFVRMLVRERLIDSKRAEALNKYIADQFGS